MLLYQTFQAGHSSGCVFMYHMLSMLHKLKAEEAVDAHCLPVICMLSL